MGLYHILFLPFLSGYIFYKYSSLTRVSFRKSNTNDHIIMAGAFGLLLLLGAFSVLHWFPFVNWSMKVVCDFLDKGMIYEYRFIEECGFSLVLALIFIPITIWGLKIKIPDSVLNEGNKISLEQIVYGWSIKKYGNSLDNYLYNALRKQNNIEIVLKNKKVYIGFVKSPNSETCLTLLPLVSGYRDADFRLKITTMYDKDDLLKDNSNLDYSISIPINEILSFRNFDWSVYERVFEAQNPSNSEEVGPKTTEKSVSQRLLGCINQFFKA